MYAYFKCVCATLYLGRHKGLIKWILPDVPVQGKATRRRNMKAHFGGKDSDNMQSSQSNGGRGVMVGGSAVKWSRDTVHTIYVTLSQGLITAGCEQCVDLRVGNTADYRIKVRRAHIVQSSELCARSACHEIRK